MTPNPLIATVGGDPGPARALAPVLKKIADDEQTAAYLLYYGHAKDIWQKLNLARTPLSSKLDFSGAVRLLKEIDATALLVGTSYNDLMLEHLFIDAARELGLPSLSVLDFPSHFKARFSNRDSSLIHLPDAIAVDSSETMHRMLAEGFSKSRIEVTGAPAFDALAGFAKSIKPGKRQELRRNLAVDPNDIFVLFASQPLTRLYNIRPGNLGQLGYDEISVLKFFIQVLEDISKEQNRKVRLVVRPHPREDPAKFESLSVKEIHLTVNDNLTSWEAIVAADLVAGMNSVLLMEACHLGRLVVSVQPGLRQPDPLPTNLSGHSQAVYDTKQLKPVMQSLLFDENFRHSILERLDGLKSDGLATARVLELLLKMAKAKP